MIVKTTYVTSQYIIPRPYHDPAMYALKLFRSPYTCSFQQAVDKAYDLYTDRSFKYHIPRRDFHKDILIKHLRRYIESRRL